MPYNIFLITYFVDLSHLLIHLFIYLFIFFFDLYFFFTTMIVEGTNDIVILHKAFRKITNQLTTISLNESIEPPTSTNLLRI